MVEKLIAAGAGKSVATDSFPIETAHGAAVRTGHLAITALLVIVVLLLVDVLRTTTSRSSTPTSMYTTY